MITRLSAIRLKRSVSWNYSQHDLE